MLILIESVWLHLVNPGTIFFFDYYQRNTDHTNELVEYPIAKFIYMAMTVILSSMTPTSHVTYPSRSASSIHFVFLIRVCVSLTYADARLQWKESSFRSTRIVVPLNIYLYVRRDQPVGTPFRGKEPENENFRNFEKVEGKTFND